MGWCQSNRLKDHFEKTKCYSEYLYIYLARPVSTESARALLVLHFIYKRDNLSDSMTGSNLSSLWHASLLHSSRQAALNLWKSSSKQGELHQVEAGVTHILPVSSLVMQMKNLSLCWKNGEECSSTLSPTLLIATNFEQMLPYHRHITISVWDSLEKHYWAAHSFCSLFIVERVFTRRKKTVCCHQHPMVLRGVDIIYDVIYHLWYCHIENHIHVSIDRDYSIPRLV